MTALMERASLKVLLRVSRAFDLSEVRRHARESGLGAMAEDACGVMHVVGRCRGGRWRHVGTPGGKRHTHCESII